MNLINTWVIFVAERHKYLAQKCFADKKSQRLVRLRRFFNRMMRNIEYSECLSSRR
ncbi:hypothetical protein FP739_10365 [Vibrio parahaemolyticus]|nr:hypothetical protein [Vibrio parahaemolyticus]EGR0255054.1 hypothetical protein [Vibrio parahaemolyticus]EGR3256282.1 hypothetical protein [Vibrio parahaemolyticus]NCM88373.1 hypothetical protein [Vibrio parahaemolyticus]NCN14197.1 hypothetical protein [Vibrio parahaemolyticus]